MRHQAFIELREIACDEVVMRRLQRVMDWEQRWFEVATRRVVFDASLLAAMVNVPVFRANALEEAESVLGRETVRRAAIWGQRLALQDNPGDECWELSTTTLLSKPKSPLDGGRP